MATAQTLTNARIAASITASIAKSTDFQNVSQNFSKAIAEALAAGTGSGEADLLWADSRALIADATEDLDLAGVLTDIFGDTVTFADVKAILIYNASTTASVISIMGAAANGFVGPFGAASQKINIPAGGFVMFGHPGAGWTVTAGTGDLITITEESTLAAVYEIAIIGATG